uniref:CTCK domain-containing protein n=2 Tax=Octopus bimaculoides TaxID=37653 RepID=A0A0L8HZG1_OCTBM
MCRPQPNAIVHANWTEWTQWTECSRSCQPGGLRSRTRFCSNPLPRCGGDKCSGDAVEVKPCNEQEFCCTYTPWSFWSSCSASCGPGIQTRQRQSMDKNNCDVDPINERKTCEVQPCEAACGQWSNWSSCSGDCNLGTRFRQFIVYSTESTNSLCKTKYDFVKCNLENKCNCSNLEEWSVIAGCEAKCEELVSPANSSFCENWNYGCKCINGLYRDKNGKCVRRDQCDLSCSVNGTIKMNQDIWKKRDDNCTLCQCIRGKIKCERICKIPVCQENEDLIYLDSNTCCPVCKPKNFAQCQMKYEFTYLENRTSQCRSTTEIKVPYCSGKCGLSTVKPALLTKKPVDQLDLLFENKCLCCKGKASKIKEVIALCGPDQEKTVMYYPQICSCECSRCQ